MCAPTKINTESGENVGRSNGHDFAHNFDSDSKTLTLTLRPTPAMSIFPPKRLELIFKWPGNCGT